MPTYPDHEGFVRTNGHRIYYRSLGTARHGTVLVVHGGPTSHGYLRCLADLVPHGYRVVWFDQWGCGRSGRPRSYHDYTPAAAADDVVAVADGLRLRSTHLFGHSWGGALALQAITGAPKRFRSVILCGGFASDASFRTAMQEHIRSLPASLRIPIERGEREKRYRGRTYRDAVRRRRKEYSLGMKVLPFDLAAVEPSINPRLLRAIYGNRPGLLSPTTGTLRDWDVRSRLRGVRIPCLVLAGKREAGRATAQEIHRLIPRSHLILFPGAGHFPFLQHRDRFMAVVLAFLSAVDRDAARRSGP